MDDVIAWVSDEQQQDDAQDQCDLQHPEQELDEPRDDRGAARPHGACALGRPHGAPARLGYVRIIRRGLLDRRTLDIGHRWASCLRAAGCRLLARGHISREGQSACSDLSVALAQMARARLSVLVGTEHRGVTSLKRAIASAGSPGRPCSSPDPASAT